MRGVNWESSLEIGIRLIAWSWVWKFLENIEDDFRNEWLEAVCKHCFRIQESFSQYSSANNHLIGEAAGLFIASTVWPCWEESKEWQEKRDRFISEKIDVTKYMIGKIEQFSKKE